ncbi:hypothetical protein EUX98_g5787 [Antrodiella citrinella]|uniref:Uncharacterized protein n=1 Tax=Antrodiella citrinella TaxID=2447956 RepID=A0A4V3XIB6_9APHY|nr:hypothetical protein EUX98_g5787 [Antrodiella citrinella]
MVVNYMSSDKSTLTTCSLLSHRWSSSTFPKLFRSITVYIEDMVKTPPCNWTSDHTLDALAGLLASDGAFESKVLVAYVKHLRVVGNGFYSNRPVDVECLFSIIDKLNLDSFCLSGAYLTSCLPEAFKAVYASQHPIPKKLRLLRLDDVCIYPLAALTRALKEEENEEKEKQDEDGDEDDSDDDDLDEDNNDDDTDDDDDDDDEDEDALTVCPLVQVLEHV